MYVAGIFVWVAPNGEWLLWKVKRMIEALLFREFMLVRTVAIVTLCAICYES